MASRDGRAPSERREPLTRTRILEAALRLVDREGAEALTMRRLGRELGVAAMSLYNHVQGREQLLDGLSEVMVAAIGAEREADTPRAALHQFTAGIRAVALAHPEAFKLVGMRPLQTPRAYRPVEVALRALREMGFDDEHAVHAYRALVAYARGFALAEIGGFTFESAYTTPDAPRPSELDAESFPHIVELAAQLEGGDRGAAFAFGTEAMLAGLEAVARQCGKAAP